MLELCSVWMKFYPTIPVWDVHAVSHADEGIEPYSTPCLTYYYVSLVCWGCSLFFLSACVVLMHMCCCYFLLSLFVCLGGRVKITQFYPFWIQGSGLWRIVGYIASLWVIALQLG